jgi:uncharacterized membrane protein YhaH (DUF805 family)
MTRQGFWLRHLLALPAALALVITAQALDSVVELATSAALTLFLVSTWSRRLHDRGYSAWRLLALLIPVAGALYLGIECAFRKGNTQTNSFGSPVGERAQYTTVGASG